MLFGINMKVITTENTGLPGSADAVTHALAKPSEPLHVEFSFPKATRGERLFTP